MTATELFGSARWMRVPGCMTPYVRGEFSLSRPVKEAWITVCGLGLHRLYINGSMIGDDLYGTLATDFHPTDAAAPYSHHCIKAYGEKLAHRIWCRKLDVTDALNEGANCLGMALAGGWYHCAASYGGTINYGDNKLCFTLEVTYADGSIERVDSGDWLRWTQSPIVGYHFHFYEHHDYSAYRLDGWNEVGFDMSGWEPLTETTAPDTEYGLQDCPPDRVIRTIKPRLVGETDAAYIYDMGENITGTPVIACRTKDICKIECRVSERLKDGDIEDYTNHKQNCSFVTDGSDRLYSLKFMWMGFRYASVTKNAEIVSCEVIHTDAAVTSSFKSDNSLLNWMYDAYLRTQLDNMHLGIPSDCPHLEKHGYTGDGELVCECVMMMTDAKKFYRKWLYDISDCQDRISGHVQYTAPYTHSGGGPGGWGCAIAEVPYQYYKMYGDKSVLAEFLPKVLHYFDYLEAHSENDLVVSDQPGDWCLGDWCTPEEIAIPAPYVNNYFYVKTINRLIEFCEVLGKNDLIPALRERSERKKAAMIRDYYDSSTGDFAGNIQGANAFAVDIGLGDARTLANIVAHYEKDTWYDTGIFGTDIVTRVLFEKGYDQLAYNLLTSEGPYSFHEWMSTGCTTLPEYWTYKRSQNHPMFGAVVRYLFQYLLGIRQEGSGYASLVIDPRFVDGMNWAQGHITTEYGIVAVKYVKSEDHISVTADIPEGCTAVLLHNGGQIPLTAGNNRVILK
ncbi:MAG: family 78 glycoside hydrolase catalytic domain [Clostridia bacterium]|nr:family 78 glycoside hydrolase catalytic domain [Clostridia bacterium]